MAKKKKATRKPKKKEQSDAWPLVLGLALLIIIVTILITLLSQDETYPVEASASSAIAAFRAQNVSEIILIDIATDFASGNFTLKDLDGKYPGYEDDIRLVNERLSSQENEIVALVNGEQITRNELERQMGLLPPQLQQLMGEEQVLAQMIDEKLLLQEANARGVAPSQEDIDAAYQDLLVQGNITEAQLLDNVATYGLQIEDIREMLIQQQTVTLLLEQTVEDAVDVSEEAKRQFYQDNIESFASDEEVTVRHILISNAQSTPQAAFDEAQATLERIEDGEDFCDLVTESSDDAGSVQNCGEYTFGRGFMVPPFEELSFELEAGEIGLVNTSFGTHVVEKLSQTDAATTSYEEVEEQIAEQLANSQRTVAYQDFIEQLRVDATIVNYLTNPSAINSNVILDIDDGEIIVDDMPNTNVNAQANIVAPAEPVEVVEPVEIVEPEPVVAEPVEREPATPTEPQELSLDDLAACLAENAILYTSSWATSSLKEAEKFGDAASELVVIDCAEENCPVSAYPAWEINGATHLGSKSFEELEELAEC